MQKAAAITFCEYQYAVHCAAPSILKNNSCACPILLVHRVTFPWATLRTLSIGPLPCGNAVFIFALVESTGAGIARRKATAGSHLLGCWLCADDVIPDVVLRCISGRGHDKGLSLPFIAADGKAKPVTSLLQHLIAKFTSYKSTRNLGPRGCLLALQGVITRHH